jgi:hypothetical protein
MNIIKKISVVLVLFLGSFAVHSTPAQAALTGCTLQVTAMSGMSVTSFRGTCTGWTGSGLRFFKIKAQCFPSGEWHTYSGGWYAAVAGWQTMSRGAYWNCSTLANRQFVYSY